MSEPTTLGSGTVAALESAWADIRSLNPDVAEHVVLRIGSGRTGRRGGLALGSITVAPDWQQSRPSSSRAKSDPKRYHAIFIAGETLAQHPVKLLETLIHEAAHSVAITRSVKDCSRQNRYHNKRFKATAEEMGLSWEHLQYRQTRADEDGVRHRIDNPDYDSEGGYSISTNAQWPTETAAADEIIGFSDMTITKDTARLYRDTVANLDTNVSVRLNAEPLKYHAPRRRRQVVVVRATNGPGLVDSPEEHDEDDDPLRIGVVVYQGLLLRGLLTSEHVAWIEEV